MSRVPASDTPVTRPQTTDEKVVPCGAAPDAQQRQIEEAAAVQRQSADAARVHHVPMALLSVASSGAAPALTVTCSVTAPGLQRGIHARPLIDSHIDIRDRHRLKPGQRHLNLISARRQVGKDVVPQAVGVDASMSIPGRRSSPSPWRR